MIASLHRSHEINALQKLLKGFPVTAILGPRQSGKTFLAGQLGASHYFDLENPRDMAKLEAPQTLLENLRGLIVVDEIQRLPELFPLLRYLVDRKQRQKYLILGSASPDLLRQSSETLAGRIAFYPLGGLMPWDVKSDALPKLWLRGGFPRAYLAKSTEQTFIWLENYIRTFLERDIPQLGISIPANTLRRFWMMLSHYHGQILNHAELARSFGISDMTVRKYTDILEGTFMVRLLRPWFNNTGKRLVKQPKIYLRDSGIFHALMSIGSQNQLLSHPKLGASWEGFALECVTKSLNKLPAELFFWSTHSGAEVDLFWKHRGKHWGIEFKFTDAPVKTKSMQVAVQDLELSRLWVVYPGRDRYSLGPKIEALPLEQIGSVWNY